MIINIMENTYIKLPFGIFRKDAIICILCGTQEIDGGTFEKKQIIYILDVRMINGTSQIYHFKNIEERNNSYNECVKILTTNN